MRSAPVGILTPSDSEPGLWYDVTPEHCPCKSFQFGHARDASFRCKHQRRHFPAPAPVTFTCVGCGLWPARQDDVICRHCRDAQDAAAMAALPVDEADWADWEPDGDEDGQTDERERQQYADDALPVEATPIYRETLLSVCYAAPEGGSTDALHGAIAEGRARHEAAMRAPVGTFTLLASNPYSDLFD